MIMTGVVFYLMKTKCQVEFSSISGARPSIAIYYTSDIIFLQSSTSFLSWDVSNRSQARALMRYRRWSAGMSIHLFCESALHRLTTSRNKMRRGIYRHRLILFANWYITSISRSSDSTRQIIVLSLKYHAAFAFSVINSISKYSDSIRTLFAD